MRSQYENTPFLDGESHDDFAPHLGKMVHELEILGDPEDPRKIAVRVALVAVSIESLLDISTMSIEEIIDRLRGRSSGAGGGASHGAEGRRTGAAWQGGEEPARVALLGREERGRRARRCSAGRKREESRSTSIS
jgi:hypothetical protein